MSAEAYLSQLLALLPPGAAWHTEPGDTRERLLSALAAGAAQAGEPLGAWSQGALECELRRIQQTHTELVFQYV